MIIVIPSKLFNCSLIFPVVTTTTATSISHTTADEHEWMFSIGEVGHLLGNLGAVEGIDYVYTFHDNRLAIRFMTAEHGVAFKLCLDGK